MNDRNRSGSLDYQEVPQVINQVFMQLGLGPADHDDLDFCMDKFDRTGDGKLNRNEFKRMLKYLGGIKQY